MELEELKNKWNLLEERLNVLDKYQENIIRKMLVGKSNKSLSYLLGFDMFGFTTALIAVPITVWIYYSPIGASLSGKLFAWTLLVFLFISIILGVFHLNYLMKIDFTKNIKHNSLYINKYNTLVQKEKIFSIFIIVILYAFGIVLYANYHANIIQWVFLVCTYIIAAVLSYYQYKKLYDKNIQSIQKNLETLKELEE